MSDPKSRIFIGQGFVVKPSLDKAMVVIERMLKNHPEMIALLEFTSQGRNRRQIDLALVGPGGIDLIEVKNKHGIVQGTVDGRWTVTNERGYTDNFSNFKRGKEENPYQQARNSADDFRDWITNATGQEVWVSPIVWLPSASAKSQIATEDFVKCAVGVDALPSRLRSSIKRSDEWGNFDYQQLPELLGLKPMTVSFLSGRVVESYKHEAVSGLAIMLRASDTQEAIETDTHGQFEFGVRKGMSFQLAVGVPEKYVQPAVMNLVAERDYWQIPQIVLQEKLPKKTEDEIRDEERQVWQAQLEQLQSTMQQHVNHTLNLEEGQLLIARKMDEISHELTRERLKLKEKEALLSQQAKQLEEMQRLPLPVQAQHAAEITALQTQTQRIELALTWMQVSNNPAQKMDALERGLETLVDVAVSRRLALMDTPAAPHSQLRVPEQNKPAALEADLIDAEFRLIDEPPVRVEHIRKPVPVQTAVPAPVAVVVPPTSSTLPAPTAAVPLPPKAPAPKLWPLMVGLGVLLAIGTGWFWQQQQVSTRVVQESQQSEQTTSPEITSAPTTAANDLPGKSVEDAAAAATSPAADALPGVPVPEGATH